MTQGNAFEDVSTTEFAVQLGELAHDVGDAELARELAGLGVVGERCARAELSLRHQLEDTGRRVNFATQLIAEKRRSSAPPPQP